MLAKTKEDAHILAWLFRKKFAASDGAMAGEVRKEDVASGKLEVKVAFHDRPCELCSMKVLRRETENKKRKTYNVNLVFRGKALQSASCTCVDATENGTAVCKHACLVRMVSKQPGAVGAITAAGAGRGRGGRGRGRGSRLAALAEGCHQPEPLWW